jgi:hypothetical protein
VSGCVAAAIAALLVPWPLAFNETARVNLGWIWVFYYFLAVGLAHLVRRVLPGHFRTGALVFGILAFGLIPLVRPFGKDDVAFRNLYEDMKLVKNDPAGEGKVLIVQAHFMAHYYPDFSLARVDPTKYVIFGEERGGNVFEGLLSRIEDLPEVRTVWLIVPFEAGAESWARAQAIDIPTFRLVNHIHGKSSEMLQFRSMRGPSTKDTQYPADQERGGQ